MPSSCSAVSPPGTWELGLLIPVLTPGSEQGAGHAGESGGGEGEVSAAETAYSVRASELSEGRDHGLGARRRPPGRTPRRAQVQAGTVKKRTA